MSQLQSIDLEEGARLAGGNRDIALSMLQELQKTLPDHLAQMRTALQQKQHQQFYDCVHRLYGGLCYCGVPELRAVLAQLKDACLEQRYSDVEQQWLELEAAAARLCAALQCLV